MIRAIVTTPDAPSPADLAEATAEASRLGLPLVARGRGGLARLLAHEAVDAVLVVSPRDRALWVGGIGQPLRFHGAMGVPRARHLARGGRDALIDVTGLRPGERVIDATAGRCADTLVAAEAVGPGGEVVGVEANPLVHAVMSHGLARLGAPVTLVCDDHARWLRAQPDRSADVVLFDPMFRAPAASQGDFEVLRRLAEHRPLSPETLSEATRVARRRVVVTDGAEGTELARLGLKDVRASRGATRRFGVVDV